MPNDSLYTKNKIIDNFLVFLEKTGNEKAHMALINRCASEMSKRVSIQTKVLLKSIEKDMFNSQPGDKKMIGMNGLLKSLGYISK